MSLKRPGDRPAPESVADRLLACHERIRRFSALGVTIAGSVAAPASEVAAAAESVHRYFTVALPLHVADEDASIAPRLLAREADGPVAEALATMSREHVAIEELIGELAPHWAAAARHELTAVELSRHLDAAKRR
ncbi:MAG: hemerythrin domain-containing protein, partial [Planctomycetota bacterium]